MQNLCDIRLNWGKHKLCTTNNEGGKEMRNVHFGVIY